MQDNMNASRRSHLCRFQNNPKLQSDWCLRPRLKLQTPKLCRLPRCLQVKGGGFGRTRNPRKQQPPQHAGFASATLAAGAGTASNRRTSLRPMIQVPDSTTTNLPERSVKGIVDIRNGHRKPGLKLDEERKNSTPRQHSRTVSCKKWKATLFPITARRL